MSVAATRPSDIVPTGLAFGSVRWGAHLCHFFKTAADVEEVAVPYFATGLANHEKCIWIVSTPLTTQRARGALAAAVRDLEQLVADGQLAIVDRVAWIEQTGVLDSERRIAHWLAAERAALAEGFAGLRITGDTAWIESADWRALAIHEARLHRALHGRRLTALCSYALDRCGPLEIIDVLRNHKSALMRRDGEWEHIGSATAALVLAGSVPGLDCDVSTILEAESARRAAAETAALGSREHLVVLQRITSALGEAATYDNIGSVVTAELAPAVGATRCGLVIGGALIALRGITTPDDTRSLAQLLDHVPAQWSVRGAMAPELGWVGGALVAVLPLVFSHDRIGTLLLGFDRAAISVAQRALVDDLVRQLSLSVERARVYEQATLERLRAERASAAKDQFLAMLGHELRNPLSPILSATQLMRLRAPDQCVKERTTIERSVTHMIRLVDDLLDVAQLARGEVTLAREPTELGALVQRAVDTARGVIDDNVRFAIDVPQTLVVDVDPARIQQVLVNLVINAAKSSAERPVEITARARGETVELVVRDHGRGIDPELLPHVFDMFVQGKQGTERARGGLGVGLPIARSIVELHGGTIAAASAGVGAGSTFTIGLPRWQTDRNTDEVAVPTLGGRRIVVVDDNEDAAWLLAEALRLLGHDVRVAHDGLAALELARDWTPEIALLDIGLPGMNGFDLCRELGKLGKRPYCIAVSGYGQPKDRAQAREAGFDAHFVKPVDLRDVQAAIDALSASN